MQLKLIAVLVASALVGVASAQFLPKEEPFRAELGLYVPSFSEGGKSLGGTVGVGYSFYRKQSLDVAAVVRYSFFSGDVEGFDYDASLVTYGVDARYRFKDTPFFVGVGLAAAQTNLDLGGGFSGDTTKLGYSVEAGYDFTKKLYGLVRFQDVVANDVPPYRGFTVGVGYRF